MHYLFYSNYINTTYLNRDIQIKLKYILSWIYPIERFSSHSHITEQKSISWCEQISYLHTQFRKCVVHVVIDLTQIISHYLFKFIKNQVQWCKDEIHYDDGRKSDHIYFYIITFSHTFYLCKITLKYYCNITTF